MDCRAIVNAGRPAALACWFAVFCVSVLRAGDGQPAKTPPAAPQQPPQISATIRAMRGDAALHDISFVGPKLGWAVGDRGVIWHTEDGGATWRQQESAVACRLSGVSFIDATQGWAVGGESRPQHGSSRGVVLRTTDGGGTWLAVPRLILPRLRGGKFFDAKNGVVFGESASYLPAGVFSTNDGGVTWTALAADAAGDWIAGDFLAPDVGAIGGAAGQIGTIAKRQVVHSPLATASLRSFRAMRLVAPTGGWAVGDGGLVLTTHDLGRSWQTPPTDLPQAADNFDFRAVAVQGSQVWIAGSPGTRVWHSPDDGQTWESIATGQTAPLCAITFVDATHGWAAGDLGKILVTHDGGQTWHAQRSGGDRAALLALFAQPTDVPLEVVADAGAADGYIAAIELLCSPTDAVANKNRHAATERWNEAMRLSGAAAGDTAWRFSLPNLDLSPAPADLLAALNRENDGRAIEQLQRQLVRQLRMWRPDVVVTHHNQTAAGGPMGALVEQLVAQAISAAADPAQQAELATDVGLGPWQVKKVYGVLPAGSHGDETLATGRFSPWLGAELGDFVWPARRLLADEHTSAPDSCELKLLFSSVADNTTARGLFAGIALAPGSDGRRAQVEAPTQDLDALKQLAARRRHLQELLERSEGSAAWGGQVSGMIDGLGPDEGGKLLAQLADGYCAKGQLDLAADTYFLLARRFPDHRLTDSALEWLVKFYASSEVAQRVKITLGAPVLADKRQRLPVAEDDSAVRQASTTTPIVSAAPPATSLSRDDRLRRAVQLADYLKTARPTLYAEPSVRFAETTAQRELGYANPAQRFFLTLKQLPDSDPWRECGATEEWLAQPADLPPGKKLAACRPATERPHLDGQLSEAFWGKADHMRLRGDAGHSDGSPVADVQLAYDNQCLYLAVRCPKTPSVDYSTDDKPRPRDADMMEHDRVTIELDVDRDYGTAFELTVDSRGWTRDACWGDATWNPTWYVAAASDETTWTVEAAIPLGEIAIKPPASRQVWAVSARRTIPRIGYEIWSGGPDSIDSPARFGLMIFE